MPNIHWIQNEIEKHYKGADLNKGVDLDRNGKIDEAERTDLNGDGKVDSSEWQAFLKRNESQLKNLGGFFKHYYSHGTAFKPDNPIHDLLAIESEIVPAWQVRLTYHKVKKIFDAVRKDIEDEKRKGREISPLKKLVIVYKEMKKHNIKFEDQNNSLFSQNIINNGVDCDTSSYIVLTVAHEMGWPVHLVKAPKHMFIRWDEGLNIAFNVDIATALNSDPITSNEMYKRRDKFSDREIKKGIFLNNLTYEQILADFYFNRAIERHKRRDRRGAIGDYLRAIKLDPLDAQSFNNLSTIYHVSRRYKDAIASLNTAIELYPNFSGAHVNRCGNKAWVRDYKGAKKDCRRALQINPAEKMARKNLFLISAIPDPIHLSVQPRIGNGAKDARLAVGATWPVIDLSEKLHLGPWIEGGYSTQGDYHFADLLGGLALVYKNQKSSISLDAGAGYNFHAAGEDSKALIHRGGIFQYGINYDYYLTDHFSIGASIAMQHEMLSPSRLALMPGVRLTYTLW